MLAGMQQFEGAMRSCGQYGVRVEILAGTQGAAAELARDPPGLGQGVGVFAPGPAARIAGSLLGYGIIARPRYAAAWLAQALSGGGIGLGWPMRICPENSWRMCRVWVWPFEA
jgi:hypothetical protein